MKLDNENIELYLFRYKEGLLDVGERAAVEQALLSHPEWQEMADLYDPVFRLPAGAAMPYDDWQRLADGGMPAKTVTISRISGRRKTIPLLVTLAAAACLLLFVTTIVRFAATSGEQQYGPLTAETPVVPVVPVVSDLQSETSYYEDLQSEKKNKKPTLTDAIPARLGEETVLPTAPSKNNVTAMTANAEPATLLAENPREPMPTADVVNGQVSEATPLLLAGIKEPEPTTITEPDTLPTSESINKENQKVLYADNVIEWVEDSDSQPQAAITRRQQLHNVAKRATTVIAKSVATHNENMEALGDIIEEHIMSNQLLITLVASIGE